MGRAADHPIQIVASPCLDRNLLPPGQVKNGLDRRSALLARQGQATDRPLAGPQDLQGGVRTDHDIRVRRGPPCPVPLHSLVTLTVTEAGTSDLTGIYAQSWNSPSPDARPDFSMTVTSTE